MPELSHRARAFVQEHRVALQPALADRARVLEGLLKRLEVDHPLGSHVVQTPSRGTRARRLTASKS